MPSKKPIEPLIEPPMFPTKLALRDKTFRQYHDLLAAKNVRGLPQHSFAAMLAVMSVMADCSYRGKWMGAIPPRIYSGSVGPTGSHKTQRSRPITNAYHAQAGEEKGKGIIAGYCTDAGLFKVLTAHPNEPVLGVFNEMQELLQARLLTGSALVYYLNTLWDGPVSLTRNLSGHKVAKKDQSHPIASPIFAFHGNIQIESFWASVGPKFEQVANGFLNRIAFFVGEYPDELPLETEPVRTADLKRIMTHLNDIKSRNHAALPTEESQRFEWLDLSDRAKGHWRAFSMEWDKKLRSHYYGTWRDMVARVRDQVCRIAINYAADEDTREVTACQLESAIAVGRYLEAGVEYIMKHHEVTEGPQRTASLEERAIRYLKRLTAKKKDDEWVELRDIQNSFRSNSRPGSVELRKILENHEDVDEEKLPQWRAHRYRYNGTGKPRPEQAKPDCPNGSALAAVPEERLREILSTPTERSPAPPNPPGMKAVRAERERAKSRVQA